MADKSRKQIMQQKLVWSLRQVRAAKGHLSPYRYHTYDLSDNLRSILDTVCNLLNAAESQILLDLQHIE